METSGVISAKLFDFTVWGIIGNFHTSRPSLIWQNSDEEALLEVPSGQIVSDCDLKRRLPPLSNP